jgi:hypothetical protein
MGRQEKEGIEGCVPIGPIGYISVGEGERRGLVRQWNVNVATTPSGQHQVRVPD